MTLATEPTPIRAAALITTYVDVMRAIAQVEAAEGFDDYPVLKCSAVKGGRIFTDMLGLAPTRHVAGYLAFVRGELEDQRRHLYEIITGTFHVPPNELRRMVRDRLDIETIEDGGGFKSWAGANVREEASEAENAIFGDDAGGDQST